MLRFGFDDGLVLRDAASGCLWLLQGAAAEAWEQADPVAAAEALTEMVRASRSLALLPFVEGGPWPVPGGRPALEMNVAYGGPVLRIRCWEPAFAAPLAALLRPLAAASGPPAQTLDVAAVGDAMLVAIDGRVAKVGSGLGLWLLVRTLARELNLGPRCLGVLHAAGIELPFGTVLVAGCTGAGKTTLAAALLAAGGRLLADDATPIEAETHLAWPCPLAQSIKAGSWPLLAARLPELAAVAPIRMLAREVRYLAPGARMAAPLGHRVAAILLPDRQDGAVASLDPVRPSELLHALMTAGTWLSDAGDPLDDLLDWLRQVPGYRLRYDGLDDAVRLVSAIGSGAGLQ